MPLARVSERSDSTASGRAAELYLVAIVVVFAALLLCVSTIPAAFLLRGELGHAVAHHRSDLALLGFATLGALGTVYLIVSLMP